MIMDREKTGEEGPLKKLLINRQPKYSQQPFFWISLTDPEGILWEPEGMEISDDLDLLSAGEGNSTSDNEKAQ